MLASQTGIWKLGRPVGMSPKIIVLIGSASEAKYWGKSIKISVPLIRAKSGEGITFLTLFGSR
jgi:hypothetical protein